MISSDRLREVALGFPNAMERPHFDWASFRVDAPRGRIFVTLPPHHEFANVFLSVDEQSMLVESEPEIFQKVPNKWGDKGATSIILSACDDGALKSALTLSWRHAAPVRLHDLLA
jgi:hypothetical protein